MFMFRKNSNLHLNKWCKGEGPEKSRFVFNGLFLLASVEHLHCLSKAFLHVFVFSSDQ